MRRLCLLTVIGQSVHIVWFSMLLSLLWYTASSFYLLLSSLPPSCSQCCIPAAVIHSGNYLLCILWSHSPHLSLFFFLSRLLVCFFFFSSFIFLCLPGIIWCVLLCSFSAATTLSLSLSVLFLPHQRATEVSIQPQQAANAKAQADEALPTKTLVYVCVHVCVHVC